MSARTLRMGLVILAAMVVGGVLTEAFRPTVDADPEQLVRRQRERIEVQAPVLPAEPASPAGPAHLHGATSAEVAVPHRPAAAPVGEVPRIPGTPPVTALAIPPRALVLDVIRLLGSADKRQEDTTLVGDPETFAAWFARPEDGPMVRAEETTPAAEVADGTTILLDAGTYDFSEFSNAHRGAFPADITFRGLGMDRTRLVLHEVGATGETRNLAFEDLTLDTGGHYLADVRGDEPISLRFERTRVIGFDQKPGGAVLLAARHGAILARDSRFEAGFGNAPGEGSLFHVRGPFLVRFERCTLLGPFASLYEKSERAAYAYVRCRFERMAPSCRTYLETREENVLLEDCYVAYEPPGPDGYTSRSRSEINPAWK